MRLFVDEARRYAVLDHENIGRIFDFEQVDGKLCIILEYIDGWSLVEYLERHRELRRLPDVELSVFIASRVCRALQYVFERAAIVHRDISPSNIMMTREGTVKLIDFGIATRSGTRDSSLTGKPAYMAPEMVVELRADNRSDLFSLGAVLFEMLTLRAALPGRDHGGGAGAGHRRPAPLAAHAQPRHPRRGAGDRAHARCSATPRGATPPRARWAQACEHYLYDKGYGPTNLTLKQYLHALFPEFKPPRPLTRDEFPLIEPTLIPIGDAPSTPRSRRDGREEDKTPVAPLKRAYNIAVPPPDAPPTLAPGPAGPRPRRLKTRLRPR